MTMIIQIIQMSVGCQLGDLPTSVRVLSSTSTMLAALQVDAQRSTSFYFKSNVPLFKGRYDFIHPLYICGSAHPNVSDNGVINLPSVKQQILESIEIVQVNKKIHQIADNTWRMMVLTVR